MNFQAILLPAFKAFPDGKLCNVGRFFENLYRQKRNIVIFVTLGDFLNFPVIGTDQIIFFIPTVFISFRGGKRQFQATIIRFCGLSCAVNTPRRKYHLEGHRIAHIIDRIGNLAGTKFCARDVTGKSVQTLNYLGFIDRLKFDRTGDCQVLKWDHCVIICRTEIENLAVVAIKGNIFLYAIFFVCFFNIAVRFAVPIRLAHN